MIVPYAPGKFLNTTQIQTIDTTVSPVIVVVGGVAIAIAPPYLAHLREVMGDGNAQRPPDPLPGPVNTGP